MSSTALLKSHRFVMVLERFVHQEPIENRRRFCAAIRISPGYHGIVSNGHRCFRCVSPVTDPAYRSTRHHRYGIGKPLKDLAPAGTVTSTVALEANRAAAISRFISFPLDTRGACSPPSSWQKSSPVLRKRGNLVSRHVPGRSAP